MSTIINVTTNKNNYSIVEKDGKITVTGGSFNETTENTLENVVNRFKVAMRLRGEEIVTWDEQMDKYNVIARCSDGYVKIGMDGVYDFTLDVAKEVAYEHTNMGVTLMIVKVEE